MNVQSLIAMAKASGASDLHLEPGLPAAIRVRGALKASGPPIPGKVLAEGAREIIGADGWNEFLRRRSYDLSRHIQGVRCRINIMHTSRGIGLAIRLLMGFQATIEKLNLHPDLKKLLVNTHGLIIISGPTGCGKSSTMAALIQEINLAETRHIVTIESPIEYVFRPHRAYIRQREVGRDTPSFEQALMDAMREDPDVLMVGEMRDPETMRLTLNAAETGHLVLATAHSGSATEVLRRVVSSFPHEVQSGICEQLADCLVAVVCQQLRYRNDLKMQVPECEILMPTHAVKNFIRRNEFFKIGTTMETGADQGMWTTHRYRTWLDARKTWHFPGDRADEPEPDIASSAELADSELITPLAGPVEQEMISTPQPEIANCPPAIASAKAGKSQIPEGRLEIQPEEGGLEAIIDKLKKKV